MIKTRKNIAQVIIVLFQIVVLYDHCCKNLNDCPAE